MILRIIFINDVLQSKLPDPELAPEPRKDDVQDGILPPLVSQLTAGRHRAGAELCPSHHPMLITPNLENKRVRQVRLHLNVKLFNGIKMTGFVVRLFCII